MPVLQQEVGPLLQRAGIFSGDMLGIAYAHTEMLGVC